MKHAYLLIMLAMGLISVDVMADKETLFRQMVPYQDSRWLPKGSYAVPERNNREYENDILDCRNCSYDKEKDLLSCDCTGREGGGRRSVQGCRGKQIIRGPWNGKLVCD